MRLPIAFLTGSALLLGLSACSANTEEQSADHGRPEPGWFIEMLAHGRDEIPENTLPDNGGGCGTGERSDEDFERAGFSVSGCDLALKDFSYEVTTECISVRRKQAFRLNRGRQDFGE